MKKNVLAVMSVIPVALFAGGGHNGVKVKMMLTGEQRACIAEQGCPKPELKKSKDNDDLKESRECIRKAFKTCKIERPTK